MHRDTAMCLTGDKSYTWLHMTCFSKLSQIFLMYFILEDMFIPQTQLQKVAKKPLECGGLVFLQQQEKSLKQNLKGR